MTKVLTRETWSKRILIYICVSICLIVWNILIASGIACLCSVIFFSLASMTGYLYGDKYKQYKQKFEENTNEKEKWFHICYATGIIPLMYRIFLKASYVGVSNVILFIISVIIFAFILLVVLKKIYNNCRIFFEKFKIGFWVLSAFLVLYLYLHFLH